MPFAPEPATRDSKGPTPGILALRDAMMKAFPGSIDMGTYNFRPIRGARTLSVHAEGRAWDMGPTGVAQGDSAAAYLTGAYEQLGVQRIIWNRRIWDSQRVAWRSYGGINPHTDHLHIELTRAAAGSGGGIGASIGTISIGGVLGNLISPGDSVPNPLGVAADGLDGVRKIADALAYLGSREGQVRIGWGIAGTILVGAGLAILVPSLKGAAVDAVVGSGS